MSRNHENTELLSERNQRGGAGGSEYRENSEGTTSDHRKCGCPETWKVAVVVFLMCALFLGGIVIGYLLAQSSFIPRTGASDGSADSSTKQRGGESRQSAFNDFDDPQILLKFHESIFDLLASDKSKLYNLTSFMNIQIRSGTSLDRTLVDLLTSAFKSMNFDDVKIETYNSTISLPDQQNLNRFRAFMKTGNQTVVDEKFNGKGDLIPGYVAYSPPGDVQGELIYLNYGTVSDFDNANKNELQGKVAVMKTGHISLLDQIHLAECHGMIGVVVFEDFHNTAKQKRCSNNNNQVQYGVVSDPFGGDPVTPGYPSIDGMCRIPIEKTKLPRIPVQMISCSCANKILPFLKIDRSSNATARGLTARLEVFNRLSSRPIHNVVGTIFGERDPDFNIIVGASRNSLQIGSESGFDGTNLLLQIGYALSQLYFNVERHLIPKRTIRLISWGGGDFGHLGLVEFLEKYSISWKEKVVAYIDLDQPVVTLRNLDSEAETSLDIISSSSVCLESWIMAIVEQFRSKDPSFPDIMFAGHKKPDKMNKLEISAGNILSQRLNAPRTHLQMITQEIDDQSAHQVIAKLTGYLMLAIADSGVLQLKIHRTAHEIIIAVDKTVTAFSAFLPNSTSDALHTHTHQLKKSVTELENYILDHLAYEQLDEVRMINGVMLQVESALNQIFSKLNSIHDVYHVKDASLIRFLGEPGKCFVEKDVDVLFLVDISKIIGQMIGAMKIMVLVG